MLLPGTDADAPAAIRPTGAAGRALRWASVCGAYAGVLWPVSLTVSLSLSNETFALGGAEDLGGLGSPGLVLVGGLGGLGAGALVGALRAVERFRAALLLGTIGAACGAVGGGLSVPVMLACRGRLHPLLSSSLLWAAVGALAGFAASQRAGDGAARRGPDLAAGAWAVIVALWAAVVWAGACVVLRAALGVPMPFDRVSPEHAFLFAVLGAVYGAAGGAFVGLCRGRGERGQTALVLGVGGLLFGALGGGLSVWAAVLDFLHPILSSALAMAAVGFAAGLCGRLLSRRRAEDGPGEPEDDEDAAPEVKIEWVLCEPKRPWRVPRPLARVLPVLAVALGALVGATFVEAPAALVAVGLLGLTASWALYRQERRLDALEQRRV